jgi:hypothetical protein
MDDFARAFLQSCRDQGKDPVAMVKIASAISPHIAKSLAGIEKTAIGIPTGTQSHHPQPLMDKYRTKNLINASNMVGKQEAINPFTAVQTVAAAEHHTVTTRPLCQHRS